jgi:hypothetical protein
MYFCHEIEP